MSSSRHAVYIWLLCATVVVLLIGCDRSGDNIQPAQRADGAGSVDLPGIERTRVIADRGYAYGLPLVMNYEIMYEYAINRDSGLFEAPFNQIKHEGRLFTDLDTTIETPNSDMPFSLLWMDLRAEPLVLSVPDIEESRYYSVQLKDSSNFNFAYIGSRTTGNKAGNYMVMGPDWQGEQPAGISQGFRAATPFVLAIYRTQLFNQEDMPNVKNIQSSYKAQPLSAYLGQPAPAPAPAIEFPQIDKELMRENFFEYLDFLLQFAPAAPDEADIRAKLATIGVGAGKQYEFNELPSEHKAAVRFGMKVGEDNIEKFLTAKIKSVNGWRLGSFFGNRAFFQGNWLLRAAGAEASIFGNDAAEVAFLLGRFDEDDDPLDGSQHNYTLTFAAGDYPPVNAFWSVTMYDGNTKLLIKNPINRHLINSPMLPDMQKNADGSLTIYIQHDSPGPDKESNWLPAPTGPIYMVMRLYWPKTEPPSILPLGRGEWKPPGIVVAD
jgi:hypothetical protein